VDDRQELYRSWLSWVTANLGGDSRLTGIAASAATEAALLGQGFNSAAEAARLAWANAAKPPAIARAEIDNRREGSAYLAWIALALTWLLPIFVAVFNRATDVAFESRFNLALLNVILIPVGASIAIALGHSARAKIKQSGRRGGGVALSALVFGYVTLIGSPISILGLLLANDAFPFFCCV
jgi:hypothetical protein